MNIPVKKRKFTPGRRMIRLADGRSAYGYWREPVTNQLMGGTVTASSGGPPPWDMIPGGFPGPLCSDASKFLVRQRDSRAEETLPSNEIACS